jgi:hypothetical protein
MILIGSRQATMDPETSKAWNKWLYGALNKRTDALVQGMGEVVGQIRRDLRGQIAAQRDEIARLQVEVAELRGELRGRAAARSDQEADVVMPKFLDNRHAGH